jgi:D-sedoheptulose 7-phosphate isomerase
MNLIERIDEHFLETLALLDHTRESLAPAIAVAAERIVAALMSDRKVMALGNGGSAASAQHFAAEMVGRFEKERPGLAAISLVADPALLTAVAAEYDYDLVFSRQVRALGQPGDILLVACVTGQAENLIEAVHAAHERQLSVIALTGHDGGELAKLLAGDDLHLNVPSARAARVHEAHMLVLHTLVDAIDCILLDGE